jgi:hypothetical protein
MMGLLVWGAEQVIYLSGGMSDFGSEMFLVMAQASRRDGEQDARGRSLSVF